MRCENALVCLGDLLHSKFFVSRCLRLYAKLVVGHLRGRKEKIAYAWSGALTAGSRGKYLNSTTGSGVC